jgi:DNA-binding MarR family transcriptional regulator
VRAPDKHREKTDETAKAQVISSAFAANTNSASGSKRTQSDKRVVQILLWALKPLFNLRGPRSIPLPYAITFLMIALDEGKGNNAYARAVGIERRAMSRYLRDIGRRARNGGPGLGLIEVRPDPDHPQRTQVFLSEKGRTIANQVFSQLRRLSDNEEELVVAEKRGQRSNRSKSPARL